MITRSKVQEITNVNVNDPTDTANYVITDQTVSRQETIPPTIDTVYNVYLKAIETTDSE